jgi:hypothetical protein
MEVDEGRSRRSEASAVGQGRCGSMQLLDFAAARLTLNHQGGKVNWHPTDTSRALIHGRPVAVRILLMAEEPPHDLVQLVDQATAQIAAEYQRIRMRSSQDPGTAGDQGENNWAALLRSWLPSSYHVQTKGRIVATSGVASPQMDVLILSPSYPKGMLDTKLYVAAGVLGAFECKITLRPEHITKAVETSAKLSRLIRSDQDVAHRGNDHGAAHHVAYGLLAHSHDVRRFKAPVRANITRELIDADRRIVADPRECLDMLCVADLEAWNCNRTIEQVSDGFVMEAVYYRSPGSSTRPIGVFVVDLLRHLGASEPSLMAIADYFARAGLSRLEIGIEGHLWKFAELPNWLARPQ